MKRERARVEEAAQDVAAQARDVIVEGTINAPLADGTARYALPAWMPVVKWTWYALFGGLITMSISILFRTPVHMIAYALRRGEEARLGEDRPIAMRD